MYALERRGMPSMMALNTDKLTAYDLELELENDLLL